MDLFINDITRVNYILEKYTYRKRKHILLMYRELLFLQERRFETFMNVILFKQIIQDFYVENLSEEVIICLIRAGMVLTITEIWRVFVQKRDFCGNIAKSMEKSKQKKSAKTKVYNSKMAVTNVGKTCAKKSSKMSIKTAIRKTKKSMILEKSETKISFLWMIYKAKKLYQPLSICLMIKKLMKAA
jgi:hypothetical protein